MLSVTFPVSAGDDDALGHWRGLGCSRLALRRLKAEIREQSVGTIPLEGGAGLLDTPLCRDDDQLCCTGAVTSPSRQYWTCERRAASLVRGGNEGCQTRRDVVGYLIE
jgi:hypothetical protein